MARKCTRQSSASRAGVLPALTRFAGGLLQVHGHYPVRPHHRPDRGCRRPLHGCAHHSRTSGRGPASLRLLALVLRCSAGASEPARWLRRAGAEPRGDYPREGAEARHQRHPARALRRRQRRRVACSRNLDRRLRRARPVYRHEPDGDRQDSWPDGGTERRGL